MQRAPEQHAPVVAEVEVADAEVRERVREVLCAEVLHAVVADVEERELREGRDVRGEGDGAARLHEVPAEVEGVEGGAEVELGDGLDALGLESQRHGHGFRSSNKQAGSTAATPCRRGRSWRGRGA